VGFASKKAACKPCVPFYKPSLSPSAMIIPPQLPRYIENDQERGQASVPGFAGQSDLRQQNHIARHDTCIPNITPLRPTAVAIPPEVCAATFNTEKCMMHRTAFQCRRTKLGDNCRRKGSHRGKFTWGCSVACKPPPALGPDQCSAQERKEQIKSYAWRSCGAKSCTGGT
jgi:hypothetical protein